MLFKGFSGMSRRLRAWADQVPSQCAVCHAWPSRPLCNACVARFAQPAERCRHCALRVPPGVPVCGACLKNPPVFDACLAAVAKKTGVAQDKLVATEVLWAEAGVGVTVRVPDADAPWSCLSDEKGKVQGAAYTGSEGKL